MFTKFEENIVENATKASNKHWIKRCMPCLKALANEKRILILLALKNGKKSVNEIVKDTGLKQATVSQQLALLKDRGIVEAQDFGREKHYFVKEIAVFELINLVRRLSNVK